MKESVFSIQQEGQEEWLQAGMKTKCFSEFLPWVSPVWPPAVSCRCCRDLIECQPPLQVIFSDLERPLNSHSPDCAVLFFCFLGVHHWMDNLLPSAFFASGPRQGWERFVSSGVSSQLEGQKTFFFLRKKSSHCCSLFFTSCHNQTFSWQTGGVRTKAAHTTATHQDLLASSAFHSFIYLYISISIPQKAFCRGVALQEAGTNGFIMLFTCCFTRLAHLIFSFIRFWKAH